MELKKIDLKDELNFSCTMSGNCCREMEVFINPYDVLQLALATGRDTTDIIAEDLLFLENTEQGIIKPVLKAARNGCCKYNVDKKCIVHKLRPLSCRLFPVARIEDGFYVQYNSYCHGLESGRKITLGSYLENEEAGNYLKRAEEYHELIRYISQNARVSQVDAYVKQLFYMVLFDYDQVFAGEYNLDGNISKNRLCLHLGRFLVDNYFNKKEIDKQSLISKLFDEGDHFIAENFRR